MPAGRSRGRAGLNNDAPVWPWVVAGTVVVGGGVVAAIVLARRDAPPPDFVDPPPGPSPGPSPLPVFPVYPVDFIDNALAGMPTGKYRALLDGGSGVTPNGLPYEWRVYETNLVESWEYAAIVAFYYDGSFGSIGGAPGWRFWGDDPNVAHLVGRGSESAARKAVTMWAESWSALVPP